MFPLYTPRGAFLTRATPSGKHLRVRLARPLVQPGVRRLVGPPTPGPLALADAPSPPARLFRKTDPEQRILYLYRNSPSVIIGRNQVRLDRLLNMSSRRPELTLVQTRHAQNPWKEINLTRLHELGIPFVRRKSGGGTVYHVRCVASPPSLPQPPKSQRSLPRWQDLGNTNYCVFVPRAEFDRRSNAELVTRGLQSLDVPAHVNERHDICVEGFKMSRSLSLWGRGTC